MPGFKDTIIPRIVAFVDQRLRYDKDGMVPKEDFIASHLFNDQPGEYGGDDLVSGTLGETAVRFSEIHAKRVDIIRQGSSSSNSRPKTKKRVRPHFQGTLLCGGFQQSLQGDDHRLAGYGPETVWRFGPGPPGPQCPKRPTDQDGRPGIRKIVCGLWRRSGGSAGIFFPPA